MPPYRQSSGADASVPRGDLLVTFEVQWPHDPPLSDAERASVAKVFETARLAESAIASNDAANAGGGQASPQEASASAPPRRRRVHPDLQYK